MFHSNASSFAALLTESKDELRRLVAEHVRSKESSVSPATSDGISQAVTDIDTSREKQGNTRLFVIGRANLSDSASSKPNIVDPWWSASRTLQKIKPPDYSFDAAVSDPDLGRSTGHEEGGSDLLQPRKRNTSLTDTGVTTLTSHTASHSMHETHNLDAPNMSPMQGIASDKELLDQHSKVSNITGTSGVDLLTSDTSGLGVKVMLEQVGGNLDALNSPDDELEKLFSEIDKALGQK